MILPCLLAVVLLAGCGGTKNISTTTTARRTASPTDAALCLNSDQFLVTARGRKIRGSSPGGVNFTITFYGSVRATNVAFSHLDQTYVTVIGATVVDDSGNPPLHPGGPPMKLIHDDLATLRHCIEPR